MSIIDVKLLMCIGAIVVGGILAVIVDKYVWEELLKKELGGV